MSLSPDDVKRVAMLARIEVTDAESTQILEQLVGVFGLIEKMQSVDTSGVEPMSHAQDVTATSCYEVNIYDTRPDQTYRTGGIVDVASPQAFVHAADRWNTFRIAAEGAQLTVELNGVVLVDTEDTRLTSGHIGLQRAAGTVMFRNVRIRPL